MLAGGGVKFKGWGSKFKVQSLKLGVTVRRFEGLHPPRRLRAEGGNVGCEELVVGRAVALAVEGEYFAEAFQLFV